MPVGLMAALAREEHHHGTDEHRLWRASLR
jgi:hypothetical protein